MLPAAGYRSNDDGALYGRGVAGYYWSSTENGSDSWFRIFESSGASMYSDLRTSGFSVRCVAE